MADTTTITLPPAQSGERRETERRAGRLSYYVAGSGRPLLLIHSINAAASAYEMRPLFERLARHRRVYAPDLPGYGFSDRSPRDYSIRLFTDAIHDMTDVIAEDAGEGPVDALALSLSAEFLARAARENPARFATLAMVTPTGFMKGSHKKRGPAGSSREVPGVHRVLSAGFVGRKLFDALTSKTSIRYFLQRTFGRKDVPEEMVAYDWASAKQPGARSGPSRATIGSSPPSTPARSSIWKSPTSSWAPTSGSLRTIPRHATRPADEVSRRCYAPHRWTC